MMGVANSRSRTMRVKYIEAARYVILAALAKGWPVETQAEPDGTYTVRWWNVD